MEHGIGDIMFCTQCGARHDDDDQFCTQCGAPITPPTAATDMPESGTRTAATQDNTIQTSASTPISQDAAAVRPVATAAAPARRRWLPWIIALVAALTAIALCVAFLTYRAEMWGGRSLPDTATIAAEASVGGESTYQDRLTGEQVKRVLAGRGLRPELIREFSAKTRGLFLGYADHHAGQRLHSGATVGVRVSAGPGVPEGTVGQQVADVIDALESMHVPVQYKQVVVSDTTRYPAGQVVATDPADGQAVPDDQMAQGITVGVAAEGNGVPFDIVGEDAQQASDQLTSQGYQVTLEPRFSSRTYIGKISGSAPGPGSAPDPGQAITLYYGVDASADRDMLTASDHGFRTATGDLSVLAGRYCKASADGGDEDCITLEATSSRYSAGEDTAIRIAGHDEPMTLYNFSQDISGMVVEPDANHLFDADDLPMRNHLLLKDWGMFEVYAGMGIMRCGTQPISYGPGEYCDNGILRTYDPAGDWYPTENTGLTYDMQDFLVYFPVGSDINELEASGYFDAEALAVARQQDAVDTDRPFILLRDPSQYEQTSVSTDTAPHGDPFVPGNDHGVNPLVPMKPAVSNDTVYYLVEQSKPDWNTLPDLNVESDDSTDNNGKSGNKANTAASGAIFNDIAGSYGFASGSGGWTTTLQVNRDGTFSGYYSDTDLGDVSDEHPNGIRTESTFQGVFSKAKANDDGTYTLQCDADKLNIEGDIGDSRIEDGTLVTISEPYGIAPCTTFTVYPQGYDSSRIDEDVLSWSTAWYFDGIPDKLDTPIIVNDSHKESFYGES